jgi:sec-independent protein translocase protein TatA
VLRPGESWAKDKERNMPSWIGPWEIAIVVIIALLIFGPKKLPQMGQSLGKSIRGFKSGLKESQDEFKAALSDDQSAAVTPATPITPATPVAQTVSTAEATSVEAGQPTIVPPLEQTTNE